MNTTDLINQPASPTAGTRRRARTNARAARPIATTVGHTIDETLPLIDAIPGRGPPLIFLLVPWVLLGLVLAGPFLLLVTFVLAAGIVAVTAVAIIVPPYLFVRRLGRYRTRQLDRHRLLRPTTANLHNPSSYPPQIRVSTEAEGSPSVAS